jgi:hypothetical protein
MKLIKVTDKGVMHYRLKDGRIGIIYPKSGYVRTSTESYNPNFPSRLYQINPKRTIFSPDGNYVHVRVLYENIHHMVRRLSEFEERNCAIQTDR